MSSSSPDPPVAAAAGTSAGDPAAAGDAPLLVATLTDPAELTDASPELLARVGVLEVRGDLLGEVDAAWIAERFAGTSLFTLRSRAEGGQGPDDPAGRRERLTRAAAEFDLVDLEVERDAVAPLLEAVPPERRVLSWHGEPVEADELERRVERMDEVGGRYLKLVPAAARSGQELAPLDLLFEQRRPDLVAFATGEVGAWTRLVAVALGAPLVFGSLGGKAGAPGQPSVARLVRDYGLPRPLRARRLCGIVGRPVSHSLSPRLHNGAYRHLGIDALYVAFHAESFGDFWIEVVESGRFEAWGLPLRGLSVTSPFKDTALALAGASSPRAQTIGGANTLVLERGVWEAESTDPEGVVDPLRRRGLELERASAAVLGCGGAGRAAAVGLARAGCRVTLFNRGAARLRSAAQELGLAAGGWDDFEPGDFDVVVHATALGHAPDDPLPFDPARLAPRAVAVDLVYDEHQTPLVTAARAAGRDVVVGREVLLSQAVGQFRAMNGRDLPWDVAVELLGLDPDEMGPRSAASGGSR